MKLKVLIILMLMNVTEPFPAKLLRVPKIYNALITSKEKILPSEAYPASTGPIFQPIGLPVEPLILNPRLIVSKQEPGFTEKTKDSTKTAKLPAPVTFYPRYTLYYAHQPYLTLQQPILYTPYEVPHPLDTLNRQHPVSKELELAEHKDLNFQKSKMKTSQLSTVEYVKNNRPSDSNIPDIPVPPPPVRYRDTHEGETR